MMTEETPTYGIPEETTTPAPKPVSDPAGESIFDLLKAEAQKDLSESRIFEVEARPGFQIEVETNVEYKDFKRYQAAASRGVKDIAKSDALLLASLLVAEYTLSILHRGKKLTDEEGEPINFRSESFINSFGVHTAADAASKFLGEGRCISVGNRVIELAGYAEEVIELQDPTND